MPRTLKFLLVVIVAIAIPASVALALGFELGSSKEDLKLNYDVSVYDHDTGRVTIKFTRIDGGRLKPISSVDLRIPSEENMITVVSNPTSACQWLFEKMGRSG